MYLDLTKKLALHLEYQFKKYITLNSYYF